LERTETHSAFRHPKRPGLSLAGVRLRGTPPPRMGFPCCVRSPFTDMPSSIPRWSRWVDSLVGRPIPTVSLYPAAEPFPKQGLGRRPHWTFRGLLDVHSRYGLPARCVAQSDTSFSKAPTVSFPPPPLRSRRAGTGWSDPVAEWELHPLKINTFYTAHRCSRPIPHPKNVNLARIFHWPLQHTRVDKV
jgi:hypothetical protein